MLLAEMVINAICELGGE